MLISSRVRGITALFIVTLVWGTTFPAMKDLSSHFSPIWIAFLRFALAGLLLSPFLLRARYADFVAGGQLGILLFIAFMFQTEGLALTSSNRNAFVTGLNVLIVPVIGVLAGKIPERRIIIAILLALAGLFVLCWDGGAWSRGDNLALAGAVCFGLYVKWMEVTTRKSSDLMTLTAVQIVTVALCAGLWLLALLLSSNQFDWQQIEQGVRRNFINLVYLGVIATAAIISLQTWGQRQASANEAAVTYAFEPACAAGAAYFWLAETMAWRGIAGGVLLIAGIIASQWNTGSESTAAVPE
jgi:drug/metabolite transporter (DMT)-like permease